MLIDLSEKDLMHLMIMCGKQQAEWEQPEDRMHAGELRKRLLAAYRQCREDARNARTENEAPE